MIGKGYGMQKDVIWYGLLLLFVLWVILEQRLLMTSKHTIASGKLPRQPESVSFVVLADLHNRSLGKRNSRLLKRIDTLAPDFVLAAGDMINKKEVCYPGNACELLEELAKRYPVFFAYGNHEQRLEGFGKKDRTSLTEEERFCETAWTQFKAHLTGAGVRFLDNESVTLKVKSLPLRITGVSIDDRYFGFHAPKELEPSYLNTLLGDGGHSKGTEECYHILIAHNPVFFEAYTRWGADLTLSGHIHGGMMRLPVLGGVLSPQARFFPKYDAGIYSSGARHMVVSRGLGSHSIMPRIFNLPELIHIRLTGDK